MSAQNSAAAEAPAAAAGTTSAGTDLISSTVPADLLARHIRSKTVTPRPDCQVWSGTTDKGYGFIHLGGRKQRVHRVAWELRNGPIPDGLTVDHLCRIRACCNTDHMELVTPAENTRRALPFRPIPLFASPDGQRRNPHQGFRDTHCRNGHEYTAETTGSKPDGTRRCLVCRQQQRERANARRAS